MTTLPAAGYLSNSARTQGEAKTALEAIPAFLRERLGSGGGWTSVASASSVDLGAQTSRMILITGTTTITGFGTTNAGDNALFTVRFAAALTLTNGANLILPTGANITTAAGDIALVVWEGSNVWRMIGYFRANGQPLANSTTGRIGQVVGNATSAVATGTTIIPYDDTTPLITEGDQYLSQAITPQNASSTLEVEVTLSLSFNGAQDFTVALFNGSTCVQAIPGNVSGAGQARVVTFTYRAAAGSTSSQTFTVRAGPALAGGTTVNGVSSGRLYGSVPKSSIYIREILP